jgi:hypothetical protein
MFCRKCGRALEKPSTNALGLGDDCFAKVMKDKASQKEAYKYARESVVSNQGEDIKDSARHKVNEFKSYNEINQTGQSSKIIVRDKLLKIHPLNLPETTNKNALRNFVLDKALKRFPPKPFSHEVDKDEILYATLVSGRIRYIDRKKENADRNTAHFKARDPSAETIELNGEQLNEDCRKHYYERFVKTKEKIEELANSDDDYIMSLSKLQLFQSQISKEDIPNIAAQFNQSNFRDYEWKALKLGRTGNNIAKDLQNLVGEDSSFEEFNFLRGYRTGNATDSVEALNEKYLPKIKSYLDGNSLNKKDGPVSRFNMADMYVNKEVRTGPESRHKSMDSQLNYLNNTCGFRGLQIGNTVTDGERIAHLQKFTESIEDLATVLNLSPEEVTFNKTLAIAFGARGMGGSLAHYERDNNVINLTRKNGPGALAHEWFHGLENYWRVKNNKSSGTILPNRGITLTGDPKVDKALASIHGKIDTMKNRWRKTDTFKNLTKAKKEYFLSDNEIFARIGEIHVQTKLAKLNRENTYLSGCENSSLWPTKEESADLEEDLDVIVNYMKKI